MYSWLGGRPGLEIPACGVAGAQEATSVKRMLARPGVYRRGMERSQWKVRIKSQQRGERGGGTLQAEGVDVARLRPPQHPASLPAPPPAGVAVRAQDAQVGRGPSPQVRGRVTVLVAEIEEIRRPCETCRPGARHARRRGRAPPSWRGGRSSPRAGRGARPSRGGRGRRCRGRGSTCS